MPRPGHQRKVHLVPFGSQSFGEIDRLKKKDRFIGASMTNEGERFIRTDVGLSVDFRGHWITFLQRTARYLRLRALGQVETGRFLAQEEFPGFHIRGRYLPSKAALLAPTNHSDWAWSFVKLYRPKRLTTTLTFPGPLTAFMASRSASKTAESDDVATADAMEAPADTPIRVTWGFPNHFFSVFIATSY